MEDQNQIAVCPSRVDPYSHVSVSHWEIQYSGVQPSDEEVEDQGI